MRAAVAVYLPGMSIRHATGVETLDPLTVVTRSAKIKAVNSVRDMSSSSSCRVGYQGCRAIPLVSVSKQRYSLLRGLCNLGADSLMLS